MEAFTHVSLVLTTNSEFTSDSTSENSMNSNGDKFLGQSILQTESVF